MKKKTKTVIKFLPLLESPWSAVSVGNSLLPRVTPSSAHVPSSDASGTLCQQTHLKCKISKLILNITIQVTFLLYNNYNIATLAELVRRLSGPDGPGSPLGPTWKDGSCLSCSDSYTCDVCSNLHIHSKQIHVKIKINFLIKKKNPDWVW